MIERNIDRKLANRISYQIRYKRRSKGKFGRGVKICERGPRLLTDMDGWVQIRCDTSAKCP